MMMNQKLLQREISSETNNWNTLLIILVRGLLTFAPLSPGSPRSMARTNVLDDCNNALTSFIFKIINWVLALVKKNNTTKVPSSKQTAATAVLLYMLTLKMNKLTFCFREISEHLWFGFYFKVCNFKNVLAEVPRLLIYQDLLQRPINAQYILMRPWKVHSIFWTVSMWIHSPFSPIL